jgi:Domain of unknown function (DUF1905)/Bacteriocin-protection, YdeI or OmpD-Associated
MGEIHVFSGKIYKVGVIRYVDVPANVSHAIGQGAPHVAVQGEVDGVPLRTTLVSRGHGCYRVAVHSDIRKRLKADVGASVEVALERDEEPRDPVLPPALALALRQAPKAQAEFRRMSTALRHQIVRYLTSVKQQATLDRRVTKFVARLEQMSRERAKKKK